MNAPLVATEDAPVPAGGKAEWALRPDGARLRAALFPAPGEARGSVVLSGGRSEPVEKYFEVIEELRERGLAVLAHDWRGQGLSTRGPARYDQLVGDLEALVDAYQHALPRPRVAVGHSMGGCATLIALSRSAARFDGCALSAPMLGLRMGPVPRPLARGVARLARVAGRGGRDVGPGAPSARFEGNVVTHDRARFDRHRAQLAACPDLVLGAPTWAWIDAAFHAMALVARPAQLQRVNVPVVICAAQRDLVVDAAALRRAVHHLPRGRLVEVPGAYHEILMETDERRAYFWWAFDELIASLTSS